MVEDSKIKKPKVYNPKKSIQRARNQRSLSSQWSIEVSGNTYVWRTRMERVSIIRSGLPYETIEVISKRTNFPVKKVLQLLNVPQTTYNKKKRDGDLMSGRDSEVVLVLTELLDFGLDVFNKEKEKFKRWLAKPNISLGGVSPESLLDSLTGIQEVKNSLNRLETGNLG